MNVFRNVIAAVMPREELLSQRGRKGIHICGHYMRAMAKGCGLSRLKVDVSHVAC